MQFVRASERIFFLFIFPPFLCSLSPWSNCPCLFQINSIFLVLTLYHMLRGRKKGGAEAYVKNVELVKWVILQQSEQKSVTPPSSSLPPFLSLLFFLPLRHGVKAAMVLLPLLGLTWILGIFFISANTSVFAWLFTIFNSLQVWSYSRNAYVCLTKLWFYTVEPLIRDPLR